MCCSSRAYNPGGSFRFSSSVCSSGEHNYQALHLTGPSLAGTWDDRFFLCSVPQIETYDVSGIISYRSREQ